MSPQETIEQLEELIEDRRAFISVDDDPDDEIYRKDIQALKKAITAVDLRTPKKPLKVLIAGDYICPNCLSVSKAKTETLYYCIWCGQALHM